MPPFQKMLPAVDLEPFAEVASRRISSVRLGNLWHIRQESCQNGAFREPWMLRDAFSFAAFFCSLQKSRFPVHSVACTPRMLFLFFLDASRLCWHLACGMMRAWEWSGGKSEDLLLHLAVLKMATGTA
jgi:hypothetical protein